MDVYNRVILISKVNVFIAFSKLYPKSSSLSFTTMPQFLEKIQNTNTEPFELYPEVKKVVLYSEI